MIVRLIGGLGNQLFQYAAARKLSIIKKTGLKLDISAFEQYKLHSYSLAPFNIREVFAHPDEVAKLRGTNKKGLCGSFWNLSQKMRPYHARSTFAESHLRPYDPNILRAPSNVYLDGYWQSQLYFQGIEDIIREEFTIKVQPDERNRQLAAQVASDEDSVSIHVRRRDFVTNYETNRVHGFCDIDYYETSVDFMLQHVKEPHFFIFSDDPQWAIQNLRFASLSTYVTHNGPTKNYEDLRLMSACKHNIIANSSFSWWGAWLNRNQDKIVVAPRKWFRDSRLNTKDLIPSDWLRV